MASVPSLPSTGQPIDTSYVYSIVQSLISINNEISTQGHSTINNGNDSSKFVNTSDITVVAQTTSPGELNGKQSPAVGKSFTGTETFDNNTFKQTPIVIANLLANKGVNSSSAKLILTITSVTTNSFKWDAYVVAEGTANYSINFIAIGV